MLCIVNCFGEFVYCIRSSICKPMLSQNKIDKMHSAYWKNNIFAQVYTINYCAWNSTKLEMAVGAESCKMSVTTNVRPYYLPWINIDGNSLTAA